MPKIKDQFRGNLSGNLMDIFDADSILQTALFHGLCLYKKSGGFLPPTLGRKDPSHHIYDGWGKKLVHE